MVDFTKQTVTAPKSSAGLFDKLPGEIRNRIYELTLVETTDRRILPEDESFLQNEEQPKQPALTRCCRALRTETLALFYSRNTFIVSAAESLTPIARKWLEDIGEQNRRSMHQVYVCGCQGQWYFEDVSRGAREPDALLELMVPSEKTDDWGCALYAIEMDLYSLVD